MWWSLNSHSLSFLKMPRLVLTSKIPASDDEDTVSWPMPEWIVPGMLFTVMGADKSLQAVMHQHWCHVFRADPKCKHLQSVYRFPHMNPPKGSPNAMWCAQVAPPNVVTVLNVMTREVSAFQWTDACITVDCVNVTDRGHVLLYLLHRKQRGYVFQCWRMEDGTWGYRPLPHTFWDVPPLVISAHQWFLRQDVTACIAHRLSPMVLVEVITSYLAPMEWWWGAQPRHVRSDKRMTVHWI